MNNNSTNNCSKEDLRMNNNNYFAELIQFEQTRLAGTRISTTNATALQDCSALWAAFCKELEAAISKDVQLAEACEDFTLKQKSYGVSIMTGSTNFDYMAAVVVLPTGLIPNTMQEFVLPAGQYLKCQCPALDKIGAVFSFIYEGQWINENTNFALDYEKPCFEEYTAEYAQSGKLYIYAPLKAKV